MPNPNQEAYRWLASLFADQIPGLDDDDKSPLVDYLVDSIDEGEEDSVKASEHETK